AGFSGDGGPAPAAMLNYPDGLTIDAVGNLYIADHFNHRIRKVTQDGVIHTVAGNGTSGFSGDGGPAIAAGLYGPSSVAVDANGNVYLSDFFSNRVRTITPDGLIQTVAGRSTTDFSGDGGPATSASFNAP